MKKQPLFMLLAAGVLLAACGGGGTPASSLEFINYAQEADTVTPEGVPSGMELTIAIPQGENEAQIVKAEKDIIAASSVAESIGAPEGETLQQIADSYIERFKSGIAAGDLEAPCVYNLKIVCQYHNAQTVVFHVTDGVYGNGGPMEYLRLLNLADGQFVERDQIASIDEASFKQLLKNYSGLEGADEAGEIYYENYWLAPDSAGCKVLLQTGTHFFEEFAVPADVIEPYLTDMGKTLFELKAEAAASTSTASTAPTAPADDKADTAEDDTDKAQPGRGDLGGYDLRGPVKKVTYDEWSATFNEQGQLTTENGQNLKTIFPGGVKRNKDGRLTECNADGYGSRYYTYNKKGLPTEINEDGFARQLTYDADGYVATETSTVAPEMGDEEGEPEVITTKYTILEKDSYGNWTKRKDQEGNVTKRTITYY